MLNKGRNDCARLKVKQGEYCFLSYLKAFTAHISFRSRRKQCHNKHSMVNHILPHYMMSNLVMPCRTMAKKKRITIREMITNLDDSITIANCNMNYALVPKYIKLTLRP